MSLLYLIVADLPENSFFRKVPLIKVAWIQFNVSVFIGMNEYSLDSFGGLLDVQSHSLFYCYKYNQIKTENSFSC